MCLKIGSRIIFFAKVKSTKQDELIHVNQFDSQINVWYLFCKLELNIYNAIPHTWQHSRANFRSAASFIFWRNQFSRCSINGLTYKVALLKEIKLFIYKSSVEISSNTSSLCLMCFIIFKGSSSLVCVQFSVI